MGEYAKYGRDEIKIGTCEDMYYLRADQRHLVRALPGNVDPKGRDRFAIRFRFPWPDEDGCEPGQFEAYDRSVAIHGVRAPEGIDHYSVQFRAHAGYLVSLPCPESSAPQPVQIHRNGFAGAVHLVQQKMLADGRTVPVLRCGGCGTMWRVEDQADIEAIVVACRSEADQLTDGRASWWHAIADRIAAGAQL